MDLSRATNDRKLYLCKWYFRGDYLNEFIVLLSPKVMIHYISISVGLLFLPFVWAINTFWFFDEAFRKPAYDEQAAIKKCKFT